MINCINKDKWLIKPNQLVTCVEIDVDNNVSYTTTYTYDANGNLVSAYDEKSKEKKECKYSPKGELTFMSILSNGKRVFQSNKYDGAGKRIESYTSVNGIDETHLYYYDGSRMLYTTDANGNATSLNIYGAESNVIAGIRYETVTDATGDAVATSNESAYFYSKDIQGSTTAITNKALECVQAYEYTDYENSSVMHIKIRM